jgi:hypothetical protein
MPTISHTWSQKGVWDAYYRECTPTDGPPGTHDSKRICKEPAIAYRLQWRGETFHTHNEVVPLRDDDDWDYFVDVNDGRCFYGLAEHGSIASIRRKLPGNQGDTLELLPTDETLFELDALDRELYRDYLDVIGRSNVKFAMFRANCEDTEGQQETE